MFCYPFGPEPAATSHDNVLALAALTKLKEANYNMGKLLKDELAALVRVLKVGKANGNKSALVGMLVERFGNISETQFEEIVARVRELHAARGLTVALAQQPEPAPEPVPELTVVVELAPPPPPEAPLPLALARPRRGQA